MPATVWPILGKGAIALTTPGSPVDAAALEAAIAAVKASGRDAVVHGDVTAATAPEERASAMAAALSDPTVAGVVALRGGWGTAQILPLMEGFRFADHAKPILGYSDLTSLQLLLSGLGIVSFHGPMPAEPEPTRPTLEVFRDIILGLATPPPWRREIPVGASIRRGGVGEGRLVGGNLTTLCHLVGTPYLPSMKGAILFLEEIGEAPYRVSRLLTHLALAGILDELSALLLGDIGIDPEPFIPMLLERVQGPVVTGLPVGHLSGQWVLPSGSRAAIDTAAGSMKFHGRK